MDLKVEYTDSLSGELKAPPSKSYTIRAVIGGMLATGTSVIRAPLLSDDTKACIINSRNLGAEITEKKIKAGDEVIPLLEIKGTSGKLAPKKKTLDTLNSGTTIRLMTAVSSLFDQEITLTGDESIRQRPIGPLLDALGQLGVKTSSRNGYPPVKVKGPLYGGKCGIRGDVSSQFISALLMAAPCARKDTTIDITTELKSRPYVDLTLDILKVFRVKLDNQKYKRFFIPNKQVYKAAEYTVEGDYSSAAFMLGAAALTNSKVTVKNLLRESKQADKKIVEILERMGVKLNVEKNSVTVEGDGRLKGVTVDLSDSPDIVPITSVLGACAHGRTIIENVEHARLKECDRIHAMASELIKMGVEVQENRDGLRVEGVGGGGMLMGAHLDGWRDHRVVMSLAVAGLRAEGETVISDAEYIPVTYPDFVEVLRKLGGNLEIQHR